MMSYRAAGVGTLSPHRHIFASHRTAYRRAMTETLGQRVRRLREEHKFSQNDLARAADVSPNQVYLIESGRRLALRRDTLERYAKALDVPESYLLTGLEGPVLDEDVPAEDWPPLSVVLTKTTDLASSDIGKIMDFVDALQARRRLQTMEADSDDAQPADETDSPRTINGMEVVETEIYVPEMEEEELGEERRAAYDRPDEEEELRRQADPEGL